MFKEALLSKSLRQAFGGGVALLALVGAPAFAQQTTTTDQSTTNQNLDRVEITGSSIKRAQIEGALPVQTITREDISRMGVTNAEELLQNVTANTAVNTNTTAEGVGATTYGEANASLRGLGSNKTLVLVNGRRLANYATDGTAVDINSIPLSAIERIEVLKDGASGVYGSDAVAGVINFILRQNYIGTEISAYTGTSTDGGGNVNKAGFVTGFGDKEKDRFNVMLSGDAERDQSIYGSQRPYANKSWADDGLYDDSATPSGAIRTFDPTTMPNASGVIPNTLNSQGVPISDATGNNNPLGPNNCAKNGSTYDPNFPTCRFNPSPFVPLIPDVQRQNVSGSFQFKLDDNNEFFAEGFDSHSRTTVREQPSPYSVSFLAPDTAFQKANVYPAIIMNPTSPYYPTAFIAANDPAVLGQPITVSYRAFDGGGRSHTDTADQGHLVGGFRGTIKDWDYDIAVSHNSSDVNESTEDGFQSQLALVKLLSGNNAFDPFTQYQTPALAKQIAATNYIGPMVDSTLSTNAIDAKISGTAYNLPAGPLGVAAGITFRDENLNFDPSLAYESGDIAGYGANALPLDVSRNSSSVFGEVDIPIFKSFEADLAVREDRYPNVSSTNPKISFRFQPISQLLIRASYGTGFREASLPELYDPQTVATSTAFTDPVTKVLNQFNVVNGGNPNLKPEKSEQSSLGFVVDPIQGMSLSMDYFKIRVNNLVTTYAPQFVVDEAAAGNPIYEPLVQRDANGNITQITSTNINAGGVSLAGVDTDFKWRFLKSANYGNFDVGVNGTYMAKYDETLIPGQPTQHSVGDTVDASGIPLDAVSAGGIIFRWRVESTLAWTYGPYGFSATNNFQSGYYDNIPCCTASVNAIEGAGGVPPAAHVGAFSTWDIQARYTGVKNLTLRVGVKNLFDRDPPPAITLGNYFQAGYDPTYYDAHGQFVYVNATYKFN